MNTGSLLQDHLGFSGRRHFSSPWVVVGTLLWLTRLSSACTVCLAVPETLLTDRLLSSDTVVFARQDPADRFSFQVVQCLKGETGASIDLFLDSPTRRRLAADPNLVVLLVRERDAWRRLATSDRTHQQVVRRFLMEAEFWQEPDRDRTEFFLPLLGHPHRDIQELAYLELTRLPYGQVRDIASLIPTSSLSTMLESRQYLKWRSLAILLLAQDADAEARAYIEDQFANCRRYGLVTNLAAWATASIELRGAASVALIQSEYLEDLGRTEEEVRGVLAALAVHGARYGSPLRARIIEAYAVGLRLRPQVARLIFTDLASWQTDDNLAPDFELLLTTAKRLAVAGNTWTLRSRANVRAVSINHVERMKNKQE